MAAIDSQGTPIPAPWIEQVTLLVFLLRAPVCTPSAAPAGGVSSPSVLLSRESHSRPLDLTGYAACFSSTGTSLYPICCACRCSFLSIRFILSRNSHSRPLD